jgi:hypothetical protein
MEPPATLFQGVDKGSFAYKLLNKMGWSEGKGLVRSSACGRVRTSAGAGRRPAAACPERSGAPLRQRAPLRRKEWPPSISSATEHAACAVQQRAAGRARLPRHALCPRPAALAAANQPPPLSPRLGPSHREPALFPTPLCRRPSRAPISRASLSM